MCTSPMLAFQANRPNSKGVRPISFRAQDGYTEIALPCGQCMDCRLSYAKNWSIRIMHESRMHKTNCVMTLTYDNNHLSTITMYDEDIPIGLTLNRVDIQKFIRALRKELSKDGIKIRYYGVGEYGEENFRPHFHLCIFGWRPNDLKLYDRQLSVNKSTLYISKRVERIWAKGGVTVGNLNYESANYVSRYVVKKYFGKNKNKWYAGRQPEFTFMSLKPGIGYDYLVKFNSDVYNYDQIVVDGRKFGHAPRYYDTKMDVLKHDRMEEVKEKRKRENRMAEVEWEALKQKATFLEVKSKIKQRGKL